MHSQTQTQGHEAHEARLMLRRMVREGRIEPEAGAEQMRAIDDAERSGRRVLVVTDLEPRRVTRRNAA